MRPILYCLLALISICFSSLTEGTSEKKSPLIDKLIAQTDGNPSEVNLKHVDEEKANDTTKLLNDSNIFYFKILPKEAHNNKLHVNDTAKHLNNPSLANLNNKNKEGFNLTNKENFQVIEDRLTEIIKNNLEQLMRSQSQTQKAPTSPNIVESMDNFEELLTEPQSKELQKVDAKPDQMHNKITHTPSTYDALNQRLNNILKKSSKQILFKLSNIFNLSDVEHLTKDVLEKNVIDKENRIPDDTILSGRRFNSNGMQLATTLDTDSVIRSPPIMGHAEPNMLPKTVFHYDNYPLNYCDDCKRLPVLNSVPFNNIITDNARLSALKHRNGLRNIVSKIAPSLYVRPLFNRVLF